MRENSVVILGAGIAYGDLAEGGVLTADILVGADGIHSAAQMPVVGRDTPSVTGCIAWHSVVLAKRLPEHVMRLEGQNPAMQLDNDDVWSAFAKAQLP